MADVRITCITLSGSQSIHELLLMWEVLNLILAMGNGLLSGN